MNYEDRPEQLVIRMSHEEARTLRDAVVAAQFELGERQGYYTPQSFNELEHILRAVSSPSGDVWDSQAFEYSEWLDQNGYLTPSEDDEATHEELVTQFFSDTYGR